MSNFPGILVIPRRSETHLCHPLHYCTLLYTTVHCLENEITKLSNLPASTVFRSTVAVFHGLSRGDPKTNVGYKIVPVGNQPLGGFFQRCPPDHLQVNSPKVWTEEVTRGRGGSCQINNPFLANFLRTIGFRSELMNVFNGSRSLRRDSLHTPVRNTDMKMRNT
jgi:hypothetical protein